MRWAIIVLLYLFGMFVSLDSYQNKYIQRFGTNPNWYQTLLIGPLWPVTSPMLYMANWEKKKEKISD